MASNDKKMPYMDNDIAELERRNLIFRKILDISSDGFIVVDENGYIIDLNNAYCSFLGKQKKEVVGKYVLEVVKNSELPKIMKTDKTDIDVLHKLVEGQSPKQERVVAVTRGVVKQGDRVIAAVGQVKFSQETMVLAEKLHRIDSELQYYKSELKRLTSSRYSFDNMIGLSPKFNEIIKSAKRAANNDFTVLILGETGTGKEVFAHAVHYGSKRRQMPFIRVNCAAIPSELLESELFGYEEGSFTGAKKGGKKGKFELANGGTIFLDEIGDMPLSMQAKLLRVLQEREIERVGGCQPVPVNVRVIAATNRDLKELLTENKFRADLFYRLNVIQLIIPSLRERREDIRLFADGFLEELNKQFGTELSISEDTYELLEEYGWPGNIRELKNVVERAYSMVDGKLISKAQLPASILGATRHNSYAAQGKTLDGILRDVEREILLSMLIKNNYNCRLTASQLGIHRATLYKKLEKHHIPVKR